MPRHTLARACSRNAIQEKLTPINALEARRRVNRSVSLESDFTETLRDGIELTKMGTYLKGLLSNLARGIRRRYS